MTVFSTNISKLEDFEKKLFFDFIQNISGRKYVIVRSNSPIEDINMRGNYKSEVANRDVNEIYEHIDNILNSSQPDEMFIIIQDFISPGLPGHMSNERRISELEERWLIETRDDRTQVFLKTKKQSYIGSLSATNFKNAIKILCKIAGALNSDIKETTRFHCEWVWDSKRIWITQVDEVFDCLIEPSKFINLINQKEQKVPSRGSFRVLKHFLLTDSEKWKKLSSPIEFNKLGLPVPDVYLLTGIEWGEAIQQLQKEIIKDFDLMCSNHSIIIRCDIAKTLSMDDLLLPTSRVLDNSDSVVKHLNITKLFFEERGIEAKDWTFLISYQYLVKASALVHAFPLSQRIRVDALWGYPDGLHYYPHDTYYYYPENKKIREARNYKSDCLLISKKGIESIKVHSPYDWGSVLEKREVALISEWALRIANSINSQVQLMVFTRQGNTIGLNGCLPWHFTKLMIPQFTKSLKVLHSLAGIKTIRSFSDIDSANMEIALKKIKGLIIMPELEMLRNDNFIKTSAKFAAIHELPLYFYGSLLGHAFYLMAREGAKVIPIGENEPKESKITYNKLVRDKIPMIIKDAGNIYQIRRLSIKDAITLLSQKIIEEAFEIWMSKETKELPNEIADISEVIDALIKYSDFDAKEVERIQLLKKKKRGGFDELIFLEDTSIKPFTTDGSLPLFLENDKIPYRLKKKEKKFINKISNSKIGNQIKIDVPLIPLLDNNLSPIVLQENLENVKIIVNYEGNKVKIDITISDAQVNNIQEQYNGPDLQLKLF